MTDSMGPGKLVRHMQNLLYTYDKYLICIGLGPSISSVICKNLSYSGPSYPSSPVQNRNTKLLNKGLYSFRMRVCMIKTEFKSGPSMNFPVEITLCNFQLGHSLNSTTLMLLYFHLEASSSGFIQN